MKLKPLLGLLLYVLGGLSSILALLMIFGALLEYSGSEVFYAVVFSIVALLLILSGRYLRQTS